MKLWQYMKSTKDSVEYRKKPEDKTLEPTFKGQAERKEVIIKTYMKSPEKQQNPGDSDILQSKEDETLRMKSACHILHSVEEFR